MRSSCRIWTSDFQTFGAPRQLAASALIAASLLHAACAPQTPISSTAAQIDNAADPLGVHDDLQRTIAAKDRAARAWPGFDLERAVLIAAFRPAGPIYVIGDSSLPAGYRWLDDSRGISVREGAPPDSLLDLQLARDWNGRVGSATAMTFTAQEAPLLPLMLVHEAFHTFQKQRQRADPRTFAGLSDPNFPDSSSEDLALLNLESIYLARAITSSQQSAVRSNALTALAIRLRRCALLGQEECARQRAMELMEGTAAYVTSVLLDRASLAGAPLLVRDSLARELVGMRDMSRLQRWHFYTSGHAWLILLEGLGPPDWKSSVELSSPDNVLAQVLRLEPGQADSLFAVAQATPDWASAEATARTLLTAELARRDSVERAFWDRPGVPINIQFGPVRRVGRGQNLLPDGRIENTYTFGTNRITIRGGARTICCPGVLTVVPTTGRSALLNGRIVALDRMGSYEAGLLEIDVPELTIRMEHASLRVFRDSVTIVAASR